MSNPDDLVPVNASQPMDYVSNDERDSRSVVMIAKIKATNPFGIDVARKTGEIVEQAESKERP